MQFTPQQLAGGSSYMYQDEGRELAQRHSREEKLSEFARNRDEGSSLMYNVMEA